MVLFLKDSQRLSYSKDSYRRPFILGTLLVVCVEGNKIQIHPARTPPSGISAQYNLGVQKHLGMEDSDTGWNGLSPVQTHPSPAPSTCHSLSIPKQANYANYTSVDTGRYLGQTEAMWLLVIIKTSFTVVSERPRTKILDESINIP